MDLGHIEEHFHPKHGMSALKDSRARGQRPIKDQLASNWSSFDLQLIFNWSSIDLFPIDLKLLGNWMDHQFTPSEEAVPNTIQSILIVNSI